MSLLNCLKYSGYINLHIHRFFRDFINLLGKSLKYYNSPDKLKTDVADFVQYYNSLRPHQRLGFRTPNEVEAQFYA
ncbi:integrase core domain-containing protein [Victivallis vadensis]|uniref:integrase core domain-containing protein n=1 Tax=Victivallis vadensis TaxID=172901 RepID=UPI000E325AB3